MKKSIINTLKKMNTLNFITIIKMPNIMLDLKIFLQLLSSENQLYEINHMINQFNKSNRPGDNIKIKFLILKELRTRKKQIIINHHPKLL